MPLFTLALQLADQRVEWLAASQQAGQVVHGSASDQPMVGDAILVVVVGADLLVAQAGTNLRFAGGRLRGELRE